MQILQGAKICLSRKERKFFFCFSFFTFAYSAIHDSRVRRLFTTAQTTSGKPAALHGSEAMVL
ncbi:MAG TPA: hypothetical protein VF268_13715 [Gammaproteobacteria bacterium]